MENIVEALQTAGLAKREAQTYLDLLQHGESRTGKICERTKIPSSQIYALLERLLAHGLVTFTLVNNVKVFRATGPQQLTRLFEERERSMEKEKTQLIQTIEQLHTIPVVEEVGERFKYFHGLNGIKSLYAEITELWRKGDEYCVASAPVASFERMEGFFLDIVHKKRVAEGVSLRIIIDESAKKYGVIRKSMPKTDVKYLPLATRTEYGVLRDRVWLITYGAHPYGLLLHDEHFATTYQAFFELLWSQAKP